MTKSSSLMLMLLAVSITIFWYSFTCYSKSKENSQSNSPFFQTPQKESLKFSNSRLAYQLLKKFDVHSELPIQHEFETEEGIGKTLFHESSLDLASDDGYCEKHRQIFIQNPNLLTSQINYISDSQTQTILRDDVLPKIGKETMQLISPTSEESSEEEVKKPIATLFGRSIPPETNLFFTSEALYKYKSLGKHFSCLSQVSNHIPGSSVLTNSAILQKSFLDYSGKIADKPEYLNDYNKYFLPTWDLQNPQQCQDFFKHFDSLQNKGMMEDVYYFKHQAKDDNQESRIFSKGLFHRSYNETLREWLQTGILWGAAVNLLHIYNPFELNSYFYEISAYMLVASSNPLIAYFHDGFVKTLRNSLLLNSMPLSKTPSSSKCLLQKDCPDSWFMIPSYRDESFLSYESFNQELNEKGVVSDVNWVENHLRSQIKKAMIHLLRATQNNLAKRSSVYELFEVEFGLDVNMNVWFVQVNNDPNSRIHHTNQEQEFLAKMLEDHFEIVFGLLRSRVKRVVNFLNRLIEEGDAVAITEKAGGFEVKNFDKAMKEFKEISRNYFEPEFEPRKTNGFSKFIDDNDSDRSVEGSEIFGENNGFAQSFIDN